MLYPSAEGSLVQKVSMFCVLRSLSLVKQSQSRGFWAAALHITSHEHAQTPEVGHRDNLKGGIIVDFGLING